MNADTLCLGGHEFTSRFILGSGKYSVNLIHAAVTEGEAEIITLALRRAEAGPKDNIFTSYSARYYLIAEYLRCQNG